MLDDFFVRALLAAAGVACIAAPVGCVLLWRRMAYFGDTMAHSALLGVALGAVLGLGLGVGVFGVAIAVALLLIVLERTAHLATDSLLGVLSHTTLALGLVVLALSASSYRHDLIGFLFGDVLAVTAWDLAVIWGGGAAGLVVLATIWRGLVAATLHADLAQAEGIPVLRLQVIYVVLMAAIVAVGMKVVGVLLIVALAIIPAAAARALSRTPRADGDRRLDDRNRLRSARSLRLTLVRTHPPGHRSWWPRWSSSSRASRSGRSPAPSDRPARDGLPDGRPGAAPGSERGTPTQSRGRTCLRILPVALWGSSSRKRTSFGTL